MKIRDFNGDTRSKHLLKEESLNILDLCKYWIHSSKSLLKKVPRWGIGRRESV
jgi:hypothetical protein